MKYGQKQELSFWGWFLDSIGVCCNCDGRKSHWKEEREWESYNQEISRSKVDSSEQEATVRYSSTSASAPLLPALEQGDVIIDVSISLSLLMGKNARFNSDDLRTCTTTDDSEIIGASAPSNDNS
ncbi:hypothetical protein Trichorick_01125 [Candidatus Trichorickettsia mobilis]|uniref:Uncharacterized protein n=1 Tax=Candidatus Trichorickettsia mobilis TaxID=1346319 RepID=A0ABZ0UT65_9RICK|nr:hypothetical protein [Candidatus Trichorickettsia mobilis]WPY01219.1 hypothetical protein Trichorick_01125 [Candidatus Trichorickettsia mobilis]